jgi:hypothetical protein
MLFYLEAIVLALFFVVLFSYIGANNIGIE